MLALVAAAFVAAPAVLSAWRNRPRPAPPPTIATDAQQRELLQALVLHVDEWMPSLVPPPDPVLIVWPQSSAERSCPLDAAPATQHRGQTTHDLRSALIVTTAPAMCVGAPCAAGRPPDDADRRHYFPFRLDEETIPRDLTLAFYAANRSAAVLALEGSGLATITPDAIDALYFDGGDGWDGLAQQHPGVSGVVRVTRAVLSADGRAALLHADFTTDCGHRASGGYYLMRRNAAGWGVARYVQTWCNWIL